MLKVKHLEGKSHEQKYDFELKKEVGGTMDGLTYI